MCPVWTLEQDLSTKIRVLGTSGLNTVPGSCPGFWGPTPFPCYSVKEGMNLGTWAMMYIPLKPCETCVLTPGCSQGLSLS